MGERPVLLVCAGLAAVLLGDVAALATHQGDRPVARSSAAASASPSAAPTPSASAAVTPSPRPAPPPAPWRILYSTTAAATGPVAPPAQTFTVLPGGQQRARRYGASTYPLSQVNRQAGLAVTTKVLSQTTTSHLTGGYCNAYYGCPTSTVTSTEQGIILVRTAGKGSRILTRGGYDDTPVWSPDRTMIAYDRLEKTGHVIGLVGPTGNDVGVLTRPPAGSHDSQPVWAPSNTAVAAVRTNSKGSTSIVVLFLDGRPRRVLHTAPGITGLSWSPDGTTIAFLKPRIGAAASQVVGSDLWAVAVANGRVRQLTRFAPSPAAFQPVRQCFGESVLPGALGTPTYSPDGRFIAYTTTYPHRARWGNQADVQVVDLRSGLVTTSVRTPLTGCGRTAAQPVTTKLLGWVR